MVVYVLYVLKEAVLIGFQAIRFCCLEASGLAIERIEFVDGEPSTFL
jgi:hypothetical protein